MDTYKPRFADSLVKGSLIGSNYRGDDRAEIIAEPFRRINPVTRAVHVIVKVRLFGTSDETELIFTPSELVHARFPDTDKKG